MAGTLSVMLSLAKATRIETKVIYSNYREVVASEEAEHYWDIFSTTQAQNVVPIARGE
jgi:hypothetical protein